MIDIRPISDLRNHFSEIEAAVSNGSPVFLTKNGYGSMVVMSMDRYEEIVNSDIEEALDEADILAESDTRRFTHEEVFANVRKRNGKI
ncbi:MAG: type II toxin-antitoxin system Phd/YefM family antitoxin [Oscillospiraceae bacterium]|jgi:prevent-host-death family protein|nr:type II toxin-antitoxin system Phd/YefM family antitoxin [Oscillospiraceae bacterium]